MLQQVFQRFTVRDQAPIGRELLEVEKYQDHLIARIPGTLSDHNGRFHLPEALSGLPRDSKLILDLSQISRLPDEALGIIIELGKTLDSPIVVAGANKHIIENLQFKRLDPGFNFAESAYEYLARQGLGNEPQDLAGTELAVRSIQTTLLRQHREFLRNRVERKTDPDEQAYVEGGSEILRVSQSGNTRVCKVMPTSISENHGIAECFSSAMHKAAICSVQAFVVDLSGVSLVGDGPVGALISTLKQLGEDVAFYVVGADERVIAKLNKLRLLDVFKVRDSAQTALAEIAATD